MNLNLEKKTTLHKKSNFILYTIEKGEIPYLYFHMIKNVNQLITVPSIYLNKIKESIDFMDVHFDNYTYKFIYFWAKII